MSPRPQKRELKFEGLLADFPTTGNENTLYIDTGTKKIYIWTGIYEETGGGGGVPTDNNFTDLDKARSDDFKQFGVVGDADIISIGAPTSDINTTSTIYYLNGIKYSYIGETGVDPEFAVGSSQKYFGLDTNETLQKFDSVITQSQIDLGIMPIGSAFADGVGAGPGSLVTDVGNSKPIYSDFLKDQEAFHRDIIGTVYRNGTGALTQNVGNMLGLDVSAADGRDQFNNPFDFPALTNNILRPLYTTKVIGAPTNSVDTTGYDDGAGALTPFSNPNRYGFVDIVRSVRSGNFFMVPSRAEYLSFIAARDADADFSDLAAPISSDQQYTRVARIPFKNNSTDLSTTGESAIIDARPVLVGSAIPTGALGLVTTQDAYNNSASGLTEIDATRGSGKYRAYTGGNTALVLEVQADTGGATAYIKGNGYSSFEKTSINRAVDPTGTFDIRGHGNTNATQSLYVRDSANVNIYKLNDDGSTFQTGLADMNSNLISNVSDPVGLQDAATKKYVDDNSGGGIALLGETTLGSAASSVTVSSLAVKTRLTIRVYVPSTSSNTLLLLRFNSDTGSNYAMTQINANGGTVSANNSISSSIEVGEANNAKVFEATIDVSNFTSTKKGFTSKCFSGDEAYFRIREGGGVWTNTANDITSVSIHTSGGNFNTGTVLSVYG